MPLPGAAHGRNRAKLAQMPLHEGLKRVPCVPRQRFINTADLVVRDARQRVGEPCLRIDAVERGGFDRCCQRRSKNQPRGGMVFPVLAGVWYYYPFVTGKLLSRRLGTWSFWLCFLGFNAAFLPMHLTGLLGMPRRVFTYGGDMGWNWLNLWPTVAAFVFAAGFLLFVWDCVRSYREGIPAGRNPWKAGTLEWMSPSPGPAGLECCGVLCGRQPNSFRNIRHGPFAYFLL